MSKKSKIARPTRDPDHYSKRGVPYWWWPEFIRGTSADHVQDVDPQAINTTWIRNNHGNFVIPCISYGKIAAIKEKNGEVNLYMKAKDGNHSFIQGSIQQEFKQWHEDRSIDYLLLGMDPDEVILSEKDS